jgi:hypothetical protein
MTALVTDRDSLTSVQQPDGGWGYTPNGTAQVEPTCLALLALDRHAHTEALERGLTCLRQWQETDGAFRVRQGRDEAVWPTALALFTLAALDADQAAQQRAAAWLLNIQGQQLEAPAAYRRDI